MTIPQEVERMMRFTQYYDIINAIRSSADPFIDLAIVILDGEGRERALIDNSDGTDSRLVAEQLARKALETELSHVSLFDYDLDAFRFVPDDEVWRAWCIVPPTDLRDRPRTRRREETLSTDGSAPIFTCGASADLCGAVGVASNGRGAPELLRPIQTLRAVLLDDSVDASTRQLMSV